MSPGKNLYINITYLKVQDQTFYLLLCVDQSSSYLVCILFQNISAENVREFLLTLFGIMSISSVLISDGGPENSKLVTNCLTNLGITHKRISPGASGQNSAESNIKVVRHTVQKLIYQYLQDNQTIDYLTLSQICVICCTLINESRPFG